jgi:hypothetical protein
MGMDVFGRNPTTKEGEYFHNTVWWWRPLADYVCRIAPEITSACRYWQSKDGDGLVAQASIALANKLQGEIDSGGVLAYEMRRNSRLELMPNEPCDFCEGTGRRKPAPQCGAGDVRTGICNKCDGEGHVRPAITEYPFSVENVQRFIVFLRGCGGFCIS